MIRVPRLRSGVRRPERGEELRPTIPLEVRRVGDPRVSCPSIPLVWRKLAEELIVFFVPDELFVCFEGGEEARREGGREKGLDVDGRREVGGVGGSEGEGENELAREELRRVYDRVEGDGICECHRKDRSTQSRETRLKKGKTNRKKVAQSG